MAFVLFTAVVASGATQPFDDAVNQAFKSAQGNPGLDAVMIAITTSADLSTLFVFAIIITIIRRTRKIGMIFLIAMVVLAILIMYMKPFVGRHLPIYNFTPALQLPDKFTLESDSFAPFAAAFSYPSGHVSRATALAFMIGYALYKKSKVAGCVIWAFPAVVSISRIYVQAHFPSDLFGGFLIGVIISVVLSNAMKVWQPFQMSRIKGKEGNASGIQP